MSADNGKDFFHDATPSWSGFNYQGKVGLYIALDNIIKHYKDPDFNQYSIEYEWVEDFSIKKGEDYISIHQVKNKKDTVQSGYVDSVVTICGKLRGKISKNELLKFINNVKEEEKENKITEILNELKSKKIISDDNIVNNIDFNGVQLQINDISNDTIQFIIEYLRVHNEIHRRLDSFKDKIYLHTSQNVAIDFSYDKMITYEGFKSSGLIDDSLKLELEFIEQYEYESSKEKFVLMQDIDNLIIEKLKEYYNLINREIEEYENDPYEIALCLLLGLLDKHIMYRHYDIQNNINSSGSNSRSLFLFHIKNELDKEKFDMDLYHAVSLKKLFIECVEEVELDLAYESKESELLRIRYYVKIIELDFPSKEFLNFLKLINPTINVIKKYHAFGLVDPEKLKGVFLNFIRSVHKDDEELIFLNGNKKNKYLPTIKGYSSNEFNEKTIRDLISKNKNIPELYYTINTLVADLNSESNEILDIFVESESITNLREKIKKDFNKKIIDSEKNIFKPHKQRMIHFTKAIRELEE